MKEDPEVKRIETKLKEGLVTGYKEGRRFVKMRKKT